MNKFYRGIAGLRPLVASGAKCHFSTDGTINCFKVFDIPVGFHVDLAALETSYKALQKELHPDLHHSASGTSRIAADGAPDSSVVNRAYQVLNGRSSVLPIKTVFMTLINRFYETPASASVTW